MAFGLEGVGRGGGLKHKEDRNSPSSLPSLHHIGNCGKGGGISDGGVSIYRQGGEEEGIEDGGEFVLRQRQRQREGSIKRN